MPCDYSLYDENWFTEIRPSILERDGHKCKVCGVANHSLIFRGVLNGVEVFQNADGAIFTYPKSEYLETNVYAAIEPISGNPNQKAIKVVLTVAHLDHNIENNDPENLAAQCQKCHLTHDKIQHLENSRETRNKKKGLVSLFN